MRQNAEAILRSLSTSPPTDQAKELSQTVDHILQESSRLEKVLGSRLSELRVFLSEYSALKSWLDDMNVSVQGEQHSVKRQVCLSVCVCVRARMYMSESRCDAQALRLITFICVCTSQCSLQAVVGVLHPPIVQCTPLSVFQGLLHPPS